MLYYLFSIFFLSFVNVMHFYYPLIIIGLLAYIILKYGLFNLDKRNIPELYRLY